MSFYVEEGKLFSFLGPNGAGKSTTIDIISTLLSYDEGTVEIDGWRLNQDNSAIRQMIGVVFQDHMLDPLLTIRKNLELRAGFYMKEKTKIKHAVRDAAINTEIMEFIDRPYGKLSGGQKRRADIARALLNTPKILFLDEPTTGLDPQTRKNIWDTIQRLQAETGMTVFLTTHYMEEAAESDYILVIDHGEIAAKGTPGTLREKYASDILRMTCEHTETVEGILKNLNLDFTVIAGEHVVKIPATMSALPILVQCKSYILGFEVLRGTMDDAFIGITGKEIRE